MDQIARNLATDEIVLWRLAVDIQQQRIVADHAAISDLLVANPADVDFRLYAMALRNLLRAVRLAIEVYPEHEGRLNQALQHFNRQVPHASDVRDILEHFDAYAKGTGKLIRRSDMGFPPAVGFRLSSAGTEATLTLFRYSDPHADFVIERELYLDTAVATAAAVQMADDALNVIG